MLCNVPIVDRAVRVAGSQHLHIAIGILHVRLAIVDVVLMDCLFRLHHSSSVELRTIEKDSPSTKGISVDAGSFRATETWVKTLSELPRSIGLLLESQGNIVETTADVGIFTDERASQDWVTVVDYALRSGFRLTSNAFCRELCEVHLTVMGCESQRGA